VAIAWAKQAELVLKKISLINLPDTATQYQVIDFFCHHDLANILMISMC